MPRYKRKSVQQSKKDLKRKNDARDFESETVSKKAVYKLSSDFLEVFKIPEGFKIPIVHQQQRTGSESKSASTSEQQYTTSDKQPSTSPQQSTSSVKRPSIWVQPSTNSKKRPSSSQQSSTSSNKPPSSFQQSSTSSNKPPSSSQQSSTSSVNQASPFDSSVDQSSKSRGNYFAMYKRLQRKSKHMKAKEKQARENKNLNPLWKKNQTERETKTRQDKRLDPLYKEGETERETKIRKEKRLDPLYKEGETERETKIRKEKRLDPLYKEGETERETKIRKEKRLDKTYKKIETLRDSKDRKDKRLNPFYKKCETGRETKTRRGKRSDPLIKKCETERETKTRRDKRSDPLYKEGETERETKTRQDKRLDPLYKEGETERETKTRKDKRLDPLYKEGETERETKIRKEKRLDKTYKKIETLRDSKDRKDKRLNPFYKKCETGRETKTRRGKRSDPLIKKCETERETKTRQDKRLDPLYKEGETERETTCRKQKRLSVSSNITNVIEKFHSTVNNGPIYVCTSCQQLWYKHSVRKFKSVFPSADVDVIQNCPQTASVDDTVWICSTCQSHLKKGKIPPSSTMNKMTFPEQGILKKMNHLELSYVSVLLPFMKIHQEPRGKQKFLHGNMVLVPANISSTVTNLPRMTSETATIKATLKRRLKYQHHVYCLNVRPELVHQAAEFLKTTPLYKAHNVTINSEWTYSGNVDISSEEMTETDHEQVDIEDGNTNNNDVADGALQDNDGTNKASEPSKVNEQDGKNESYDSDEDDKWSEVDENELMSGQADTLLTAPDFVEPAERQLIYNFAPGEGQIPVSRLEFRRNTKGSKTKTVLPEPNIEKNDDEVENEEIDVSKDSRQYRKRKKARIIRSVHFDIKTDSEKYYRELLVLYSSWRNENDLKKSCNSFNERYLEIKDEVETERELYEPFRDIVEDAQQIINQGVEDSWDEIAPQTEMQNAMDKDNRTDPKDTGIENYDIGIDLGLQPSNQEQELNRDFELPDQEFRCHLRKLNKEQLEFVYDAIHILKTSKDPIYWFLSGGAGVGKSYVTKALYQMAVKFYSKQAGEDFSSNKVMLLAPTGKAAYHIHGNTIHSALKVPVNQKLQYKQLSSAALNTLRNQIGEVNLIFIDEISMVGFNMLNFIHQRLMEVTQKNELFGGISVIAVGDLFQLKPVMDSYLFTSPTTGYMPLATNIWKENFTMFELHEIMRQSENKPFAELLNRLREGNHNKQDISVLKERNINENTEDYPWAVPHLFCTNEKVDSFNSAIIHRKNDLVYVIRAHDKFIGSAPPGLKAKILDSFRNNKQNSKQLLNSLEVAENTYYEITANLDTTDGLINGASCKMMKVEINQISEYASGILWVQFEDQNIGKQHRRENRRLYKSCHLKEWTPLEPVSKSFAAGNKGEAQIQRSQFPIRPAHAKTVHRSQGDTLSKVVVDLTSKRRVDHIHYVAVSRVQTLDGLFIRNLQEDKIGVDKNVKTEMKRLRATTIERRLRNIYDLENSLLKICFLNASSLHRHLEDVRLDRNITNADIACFCETRFHNRDSVDATQIDAFHQYRQDSKPSGHKRPPYGLAIYSKEPFCPSFPINESSNGIELSVFRTNHNSDITIVTVYKPPHKPISELCERLLHVHETYVCNNDAIILGDLNVNWKEDSSNKQKLLTLMQQLKYKQLITQPTNDYGSTIDLIFTNIDCVDSGTNEVFFSDHKLTWLSLLAA
ncbi:unnamed protein product [Mytilus edulis]|uniref:ATP-dependent DNA helicase n=1 Tax=Mytilus edulis TaxID=6550 RepID=A0A8S3SBV8_MYTED|nr:unnamed protein product [Mytilus edulis]